MLSQPDGPFINVPKLNLAKYAQRQNLAKVKYIHQWLPMTKTVC
jgi:tetratricopeptide repeat protein 8